MAYPARRLAPEREENVITIETLAEDVVLFRGEALDSNATAVRDGGRVLLIDGLGSRADAADLKRVVEHEWGARVEWMVATHYFSDHMAAYGLFPGVPLLAHAHALHTFWSERFRTPEEASFYVEPTMRLEGSLAVRWGRNRLTIHPNVGHTMGTLNVDFEDADLLHVADTVVGNLAYFLYAPPALLDEALARAERRGRSRILCSHGGVREAGALGRARTYLRNLEARVRQVRREDDGEIDGIPLDACLAEGVPGTPFEACFHARNLETIVDRCLFPAAAPSAVLLGAAGDRRPAGLA